VKIDVVMFGKCVDAMKARSHLHIAHMAAVRPWGWPESENQRR
jgi:hypothetical protein